MVYNHALTGASKTFDFVPYCYDKRNKLIEGKYIDFNCDTIGIVTHSKLSVWGGNLLKKLPGTDGSLLRNFGCLKQYKPATKATTLKGVAYSTAAVQRQNTMKRLVALGSLQLSRD